MSVASEPATTSGPAPQGPITTSRPVTWREFTAIQDAPNLHELIRGEVITMPPPQTDHGGYAGNVFGPLYSHVKANKLGRALAAETGVILEHDPDTVRAGDVSFISAARWPKGGVGDGYFEGAPDFVVEVLSKSDTVAGIEDKIDQWLANGSRLVWLVNPRRKTVTVYRPGEPPVLYVGSQTLDCGDVVPGFRLPLPDIFALD